MDVGNILLSLCGCGCGGGLGCVCLVWSITVGGSWILPSKARPVTDPLLMARLQPILHIGCVVWVNCCVWAGCGGLLCALWAVGLLYFPTQVLV